MSSGLPQRPNGVRAMMASDRAASFARRLGEFGLDPARRDGIHADVGRPGHRQRLGQLRHAAFGGGIGRHQSAAEKRPDRGGVDDRTALFFQQRLGRHTQAHGAGEIDVDDFLKSCDGELLAVAQDNSGAIDQRVQPRQPRDAARHIRVIGHIKPDGMQMVALWHRRDFVRGQAGDGDLIARRQHGFGYAETDAPRAAGDQCLLHAAP